jgi:hypothetical protein
MNMTQSLSFLAKLLGPGAPGCRLPPGRCACHEPTVKWCTRHGRPIKPAPSGRLRAPFGA